MAINNIIEVTSDYKRIQKLPYIEPYSIKYSTPRYSYEELSEPTNLPWGNKYNNEPSIYYIVNNTKPADLYFITTPHQGWIDNGSWPPGKPPVRTVQFFKDTSQIRQPIIYGSINFDTPDNDINREPAVLLSTYDPYIVQVCYVMITNNIMTLTIKTFNLKTTQQTIVTLVEELPLYKNEQVTGGYVVRTANNTFNLRLTQKFGREVGQRYFVMYEKPPQQMYVCDKLAIPYLVKDGVLKPSEIYMVKDGIVSRVNVD